MNLIDFTTAETIRGILGVTPEELEDSVVTLPVFIQRLEIHLRRLNPNLVSSYEGLLSVGEATWTESETRLVRSVQVYSSYFLAKLFLSSLPLFAPKKITDGRAAVERVNDPFSVISQTLDGTLGELWGDLKEAADDLGMNFPVYSFSSMATSVGLAIDPVTGTAPV